MLRNVDRRFTNPTGRIVRSTAILLFLVAIAAVSGQHQGPPELLDNEHNDGVRVRYARADLRLAEIELQIALKGNQQIPNTYSVQTLQRLRNNVAYAQEMVRYETHPEKDELHKLHLREVEGQLAMAESDLATALAANERAPGSVNDLEVERLRAAVDVARLALEMARDPTAWRSPMDHLQWQLGWLRAEVTRLNVQMDRVASHN